MDVVAISNNNYDLTRGDTTLLVCVGYGEPEANVTWLRNGFQEVTNTSIISVSEEVSMYETKMFKELYLQLCSVSLKTTGTFTCVVNNDERAVNSTVELRVTGQQCLMLFLCV